MSWVLIFTYSLSGNRVSKIHDDIADSANVLDRVFSYDYDANDRLTQERVISGTNPLGSVGNTTIYFRELWDSELGPVDQLESYARFHQGA
jgi:hypothetical protein